MIRHKGDFLDLVFELAHKIISPSFAVQSYETGDIFEFAHEIFRV